jgi:hypothetical protein
MSEAIQLLAHAERLAQGPVSPRLAGELEGLGQAFEREARQLDVAVRQCIGSEAPICDKDRSKRRLNRP